MGFYRKTFAVFSLFIIMLTYTSINKGFMQEPFSTFKIGMLTASILGALVSLKYLRPNASPAERFISFIGACAGTYYATPAIILYFSLQNGTESILAFTMGIFFMQIVDIGMHIVDTYQKDPTKIIEFFIKKK